MLFLKMCVDPTQIFLLEDLNSDVSKTQSPLYQTLYIFVTGFRLSNNRLELHLLVAQCLTHLTDQIRFAIDKGNYL